VIGNESNYYLTYFIVRIAGGAVLIAAELVVPSKIDLYIAAYILQPAGLAFLMLSSIGFLGLAYVNLLEHHFFSDHSSTVGRAPTAKIHGRLCFSECLDLSG
jgi:hypothetical protein